MKFNYGDIDVIILCAGLGTRLRPMMDTIPKVMVPIAPNLPLLEHTVLLLKSQGFEKFIFNLFYLPEVITNHFGDGSKFGVRIRYSRENGEILETAGAIKKMEKMIESEDFILIYGDHLFTFDFRPLVDFHIEKRALATLLLKRSDLPQNGDLAEIDNLTKKIKKWHSRPHPHTEFGDILYLNTGLDILSKKILEYIPPNRPIKLDIDILPKLTGEDVLIYGFPTDEEILDVGTPEKYEIAKKWYQQKINKSNII